jgi:hypothetical protein
VAFTYVTETFCAVTVIVTTALCLATVLTQSLVCLVWAVVTTTICLLWDLGTTVLGFVVDLVEAVLAWPLGLLAVVGGWLFSVPVVGRLLHWLWELALTVAWGVIGLIDGVAYIVGVRPQKKLRICTLIERDNSGPVANTADVVRLINDAIDIFLARMNIQILNSAPAQFSSGLSGSGNRADNSWVKVLDNNDIALDVRCGSFTPAGFGDDLAGSGTGIQAKSVSACLFGNGRRLIGYGAPVVVLIVRSIDGGLALGCGLGPLTDYATIASFRAVILTDNNQDDLPDVPGLQPVSILNPSNGGFLTPNNTLAHELGHLCNLLHTAADPANLMFPNAGTQSGVYDTQAALVRASRHVSYF